jgi:hypothetical protein
MVNEFDNTKMLQVTAEKKGNGNELKSLLDEMACITRECKCAGICF